MRFIVQIKLGLLLVELAVQLSLLFLFGQGLPNSWRVLETVFDLLSRVVARIVLDNALLCVVFLSDLARMPLGIELRIE